jgi:hypothetical protein
LQPLGCGLFCKTLTEIDNVVCLAAEKGQAAEGTNVPGLVWKPRAVWRGRWWRGWWLGSVPVADVCWSHQVVL